VLFDGPLARDLDRGTHGTYSAGLRPGIRFSDGTPMTVQHVVASLGRSESLREQAQVAARGDRIVFQLRRENPRFDLVLTQGYCGITLDRGGRLLGSGPFVVAPDATAERMRLLKNPNYRAPVSLDEVIFIVHPPTAEQRPERLLRALDDGQVDFCSVLSRDDVSRLQNVRKTFQPGASTAILYFNTERPSLTDAAVRRALAMAINRDEIARLSYSNALAFTATGLLPPALDTSRDGVRHSLEKAQEELLRAGVAFPSRLRLLQMFGPRPYLPHPRAVSDLIVKQLRPLGLHIDVVESRDAGEFWDTIARADYDLAVAGWIADTADPADFLETLLSSEQVPEVGRGNVIRSNFSRLRSAPMDAALKRHREHPTVDNRAAVVALVREEAPLVPLMYGPTIFVQSRRVRNFTPPPVGMPSFANVELD
jgi:ABC-type transport system substrate-binding protein